MAEEIKFYIKWDINRLNLGQNLKLAEFVETGQTSNEVIKVIVEIIATMAWNPNMNCYWDKEVIIPVILNMNAMQFGFVLDAMKSSVDKSNEEQTLKQLFGLE